MPSDLPGKYFEPRKGRRYIERKAWAVLQLCRRKLGLDAVPLPVPVEHWIEGPLDIQLSITDLSHLGDGVLGGALVAEREIQVDERVLEHEGRYRFTCAHELGHLTLHADLNTAYLDTVFFAADAELYERQADRFAAAFLMPAPLVESTLVEIAAHARRPWREFAADLMLPTNNDVSIWKRQVLPMLARRFAVSWTAAAHRCSDLQLRGADDAPLLNDAAKAQLLRLPPRPPSNPLNWI